MVGAALFFPDVCGRWASIGEAEREGALRLVLRLVPDSLAVCTSAVVTDCFSVSTALHFVPFFSPFVLRLGRLFLAALFSTLRLVLSLLRTS